MNNYANYIFVGWKDFVIKEKFKTLENIRIIDLKVQKFHLLGGDIVSRSRLSDKHIFK